MIGTEMGK